jgi:hypothetical protein
VGELVAFISFFSLSISVFLESMKHIIDVIFLIPKGDNSTVFTAHGHGKNNNGKEILYRNEIL